MRALLAYVKERDGREARLEAQLGCNDSMAGLMLLIMCGASHGIGPMLGPLGVGHGQTSYILSLGVMKYNAGASAEQQQRVKTILLSEPDIATVLERTLRESDSDAGDALRAIFDELKKPRSLEEVGIGRDKWDQLAANSMADHFIKSNPREIQSPEQVKEILKMCSRGP